MEESCHLDPRRNGDAIQWEEIVSDAHANSDGGLGADVFGQIGLERLKRIKRIASN